MTPLDRLERSGSLTDLEDARQESLERALKLATGGAVHTPPAASGSDEDAIFEEAASERPPQMWLMDQSGCTLDFTLMNYGIWHNYANVSISLVMPLYCKLQSLIYYV